MCRRSPASFEALCRHLRPLRRRLRRRLHRRRLHRRRPPRGYDPSVRRSTI